MLVVGIYIGSYGQSNRLIIPDSNKNQYYIERWTTDNGLPSNTLIKIHKSKKGYIWIASFDGLAKFDGVQFTNYNRTSTNMVSNSISQIKEGANNKLWIGTYGNGIMSYQHGRFKDENSNQYLRTQSIQTLFIDGKGHLWIGTRGNGLFYHDGNINQLNLHPLLENVTISAIAQAPDGAMWFGTEGNGLIKKVDNEFQTYSAVEGMPDNKIFAIYFDNDGVMWVGNNSGLSRFNGTTFDLVKGVNSCLINKMFEDQHNNLWVATNCGLYRKNSATDQWWKLPLEGIIPSDHFTDAFIDDDESIWVTTYHAGLAHIKDSKFINYTIDDGLATKAISSIEEYDNDKYLIGTNSGIVNVIDNGKISEFNFKTPLPNTRIRSILEDKSGNIWIGTSAGMLLRKKSGKEKWYTTENGLPDNEVRIFYEDSKNNIWFGTRSGGLVKVTKDEKFEVFDKSNLLNSDFIMSIGEDKMGNMLIGTNEGGLNILKKDGTVKYLTKATGLSSNLIFSTYQDNEGIIWITTNAGISRLEEGQFVNITAADGTATDAPFDFIEDQMGNVWLPTSKGVVKVSKRQLNDFAKDNIKNINSRVYDKQDGLEVSECTGAAKSLIADDGSIWVPSLNGVLVIRPKEIGYNATPPPAFITHIKADGRNIEIRGDTTFLDADVQRITINYEALNYTAPTKVKYKFKLENFDKNWIRAEDKREVQYTNLKYGQYTFKVMASNEDGIWNEEAATLTINIAPHFYETAAFYIAVSVGALLMLAGAFKLAMYGIKKRNKILSALVEEQTAELMEINSMLEEQKEELLLQHDLLAEKNMELETAHEKITNVNEELTLVNSQLEEKVEERTKDLRATLEKLETSNEELDTFIYRASHDLKGPTASLVGLAMLGKTISNDHRYLDFFNRIEDTAHNMNGVLGKLISMHIILQNTVSYTHIDLEKLLDEIKNSFKLSRTSYSIINQTDASLLFYSDTTLLQIILKNLLENALIFNNQFAEIIIKLNVEKKGRSIYLTVEDNGEGIEAGIRDKIFDPFYRGSQKSKGNGLGLYLVKKAADKLNGKVEVVSETGKFTRFTVILPSKDIT